MKLDLAIEIMADQLTGPACLSNPNLIDATRLSVEALRRVAVRRIALGEQFEPPLYGETSPDASP